MNHVLGRTLFIVALSSAVVAAPEDAPGQTLQSGDSAIRVIVSDPTGAVIVGARVLVTAPSGATAQAMTDWDGEAMFPWVASGRYTIRAEYDGFDAVEQKDVRIRGRETRRELRLPLARVSAEVTVGRDPREARTDPRSDAFSTVLSREQIDQLPDDPDELEEALNTMAGPGAVMRVNGFRGGRLPPKSQIQEIRFRRNFFAADSHEAGVISVDVRTRPGSDALRGSFDVGFRDEALNARNAFATRKGPEQQRRFGLSLEGPLVKGRTSYAVSTDGFDNFDSKTIVAALVSGPFRDMVRRPSERLNVSARIEHALTTTHALRAEVQHGATTNRNLGVGDFDLEERAYDGTRDSRVLRLSESGPLGRHLFNELRFQVSWQDTEVTPLVSAPAVQVLNAFARGGAQVQGSRESTLIELADNLDITVGRHTMRTGMLLEGGGYRSDEARNLNGAFVFASLEAYEAGIPTTYSQIIGDPLVRYSHHQFGWYFQDDIRVRKDLTLSLGLRHEVQSHLADWNNFSPRAGFTWSPFKDGATTFRGGIGLFYDWYAADTYEHTRRVDGVSQQELVVRSPGYPDPFAGGQATVLPPGRVQADSGLRMPGITQASFGVERRLAAAAVLNVTYFETRGWDQLRGRNINAPFGGTRPDPAVGNVTQIESSARSAARRLSVNLNANAPRHRLFAALNYTFGSSRNESDDPLSLPADNYDLEGEWGPAASDARHRLMGMVTAPIWKQLRFSTHFRAASATPYNVITGFDDNGDTVSNDRPAGVSRNSARGTPHWDISGRLQYSFGFGKRPTQPSPGGVPVIHVVRPGDDGGRVGAMMGPGGPMDTRVRLDLYVAASNIFNHVNAASFSGVQTSPFFGQPTAAQPARRVELGARLGF